MERLELKTAVGSRVAIGFLLLIVLVPVAILGKTIGLVITAVVLAGFIALCIAMGKRRLFLDERGVTAKGMTGVKHVGWDEIDHYTFWSMDQNAHYYGTGGQGGAIGAIIIIAAIAIARAMTKSKKGDHRRFAQGRLTLVGSTGVKLPIDARYKDVSPALDRVFAEMHPRLRAKTPDFTPFTLTDGSLTHAKKGTLGLADVEKVNAGGARITVKKRGKRLAWARAHMKQVKNVMLFLEMAAEHGLVVDANAEVFMPPTVVDKLRAAASRQAGMPQARVVVR
jgi:hypothetical protein